jgi:hypothetical protein
MVACFMLTGFDEIKTYWTVKYFMNKLKVKVLHDLNL